MFYKKMSWKNRPKVGFFKGSDIKDDASLQASDRKY